MQITRRQLYTLFKEIADKHLQIHSFFWGDVADAFGRQDIIFPIMIVTPQPIAMRQGEVSHTYSITILDRLLDGDENKVDVDSDVYQYWRDVMAQLDRLNQVDFGIEYPMNPQPVQDVSPHRCYGFQGDVSVNVDENYDKCAVPSLPIDFNPELVCLPASYRVEYENGVLIEEGTIASGSSKTIKVPDAPICLAASWELRDTDGVVLDSGTIPSGGSATITAPNGSVSVRDSGGVELYNVSVTSGGSEVQVVGDSTVNVRRSDNSLIEAKSVKAQGSENVTVADSLVNVRKSDGVLISAVSVKADDSENYNVADSVVSNDATTPTYTANIKATENLVLPTQTIEVNGVNEGSIPSVGTIEVEVSDGVNPVTPNSVGIVGRTVTLEVPSGVTMNVDFSADKLTAAPLEDITFTDLSDETPTHWSWRFGDGTTSIVQNPVKQYFAVGIYNVTLLAGRVGAGGVAVKNAYIEIVLAYFTNLFGVPSSAYSLRKLSPNSVYSGAAIRVRRSSDNTEQDINFVSSAANAALDTAALLSFVGAGNAFIVTWYDQSGNARHATQASAANQPQIVFSGVTRISNGLPSVYFDGSDELLTPTFSLNQPTTQLSVAKIDNSYSLGTNYTIASSKTAGNRQHIFYRNTGKVAIFAGASIETIANSTAGQKLFTALFNGANSLLRKNGTQVITGNAGTQNFGGQLAIGSQSAAGNEWLGDQQEFIFYGADKTSEFAAIETNINDYYNVF
jgi:PKD repeat protein